MAQSELKTLIDHVTVVKASSVLHISFCVIIGNTQIDLSLTGYESLPSPFAITAPIYYAFIV